MKQTMMKLLVFGLYVGVLIFVHSSPDLFDGLGLLVVQIVLGYCGIIVLSQLVAAVYKLSQWCMVAGRREVDILAAPTGALETETEAI